MKKVFFIFIFAAGFTQAKQDLGLGAVLGDPTGFAVKLQTSADNAVDGALAWSSRGFHIHSNYLWQINNYFQLDQKNIDLYYGVGVRLISISSGTDKDKTSLGPRTPIGVNFKLQQTKLQFFAELAMNLNVTPSTEADLDGGIGIRFHF